MTTIRPDRFYVYSPTLGRQRVPPAYEISEGRAYDYAQLVDADNLVREQGPVSKPTASRIVWRREPLHRDTVTVWDAQGNAWTVERSALQAE